MMSLDIRADERMGKGRDESPDPPVDPTGGSPPLSIALVSPAWPPDAHSNGIVSCVAALAEGLRVLGHRAGDPSDLHAKIVALLRDPARAAELGRRAASRCGQEYHPVVVAARMAAYYRRLRKSITTPAPA